MKKKIYFLTLLVLILLTSGCSMQYDLTINKNGAEENITATLKSNKTNDKMIDELSNQKRSAYYDMNTGETHYYKQNRFYNKKNNEIGLKYNYNYAKIEELQYSNALTQCFYNVSVIKDLQFITINTSKGASCLSHDGQKLIDKIDATIQTDYKVIEHNADSHKDNTYTWNITEKNSNNKSIYIKMDYKQKNTAVAKSENTKTILLAIGLIVIIITLAIFLSKRVKKSKYE
ncbi:MAG: hypothetical protein IJF92_04055 [Bacilli bacterium]|nr:hypothetical protein [Bacilli bacterium]